MVHACSRDIYQSLQRKWKSLINEHHPLLYESLKVSTNPTSPRAKRVQEDNNQASLGILSVRSSCSGRHSLLFSSGEASLPTKGRKELSRALNSIFSLNVSSQLGSFVAAIGWNVFKFHSFPHVTTFHFCFWRLYASLCYLPKRDWPALDFMLCHVTTNP